MHLWVVKGDPVWLKAGTAFQEYKMKPTTVSEFNELILMFLSQAVVFLKANMTQNL